MKEVSFERLLDLRRYLLNDIMLIPNDWTGRDKAYYERQRRRYWNSEMLVSNYHFRNRGKQTL